jgi:putative PEP-CTERM system histidine kinase
MTTFFGLWSHLLAGGLFAITAVWQLRRWSTDRDGRPLVAALAVVAVWMLLLAALGSEHLLPRLAESARNLAFLAFMYGLMGGAADDGRQRAVKLVYAAVAGVIGLQIVIGGVMAEFRDLPLVLEALTSTGQIMGLTIAAGSLVLVHNLYGQATADSRWTIRLPMLALTAMWAYDLHLCTVAYLTRGPVADLIAMRGAVMAMLAPLFAIALQQRPGWKVQLSRAATFQSISVLAIFAYLILMMSATRAMEAVGGNWVRSGQIGFVVAITVGALVLLPSARVRAWLSVMLAKHLFEHRYDYREEWLRFTHTIGRESEDGAGIDERVVKALADIAGAPAGMLLLADDHYRLSPAARWNWPHQPPKSDGSERDCLRAVEHKAHVIDFAAATAARPGREAPAYPLPGWLAQVEDAWAGVPLIHAGRLIGLVVLAHPQLRRPLDWEDFDLFRTAGIQAASYLAEARSHQALANAQRFEEFNRRFAFILHDIKNLVSQLSLVARNAERHAGNPEFQADMVATLQSSVRKMNDLLARLSPGRARDTDPPRPTLVQPILAAIATAKRRVHPVDVFGDARLAAVADPIGLEQALGHLVQNAIDASPAAAPVRICFERRGGDAAIDVIDSGQGMSSEFVRTRLFQPFASTKESGFGVGAFEARSLVIAMGGRLDVESREGEGSRFTILLPAAEAVTIDSNERMRA